MVIIRYKFWLLLCWLCFLPLQILQASQGDVKGAEKGVSNKGNTSHDFSFDGNNKEGCGNGGCGLDSDRNGDCGGSQGGQGNGGGHGGGGFNGNHGNDRPGEAGRVVLTPSNCPLPRLSNYLNRQIGYSNLKALDLQIERLDKVASEQGMEAALKDVNGPHFRHFINGLGHPSSNREERVYFSPYVKDAATTYVIRSVAQKHRERSEKQEEQSLLKSLEDKRQNLHASLVRLGKIKTPYGTLEDIYERHRSHCFTADTKVLVKGQNHLLEYKAISELTPEDLVWTCNFNSHSCELKSIKAFDQRETEAHELLLLTVLDAYGVEHELETTGEHPFNVGPRQWRLAKDLKPGESVYDILGQKRQITKVEQLEGIFTVYNLQVDAQDYDSSNYFVSEMGLLVHNCQVLGRSMAAVGGAAMLASAFIGTGGLVLSAAPAILVGGGFVFLKVAEAKDFASAIEDGITESAIDLVGGVFIVGLSRAGKALWLAKRGKHGIAEVAAAGEKILEWAQKFNIPSNKINDFADSLRIYGGKHETVAEAAAILTKKMDFVFGKATGEAHNIMRSNDMLRQLERIGLHDCPISRTVVKENLVKTLKDPSSIAKQLDEGRVLRESLLSGPGGHVKIESIWQDNKLITVKIKGGD